MRWTSGHRSRAVCSAVLGLCIVLVLVVVGCTPENRGAVAEVDDGGGSGVAKPPKFPTNGPIPADLLVAGLAYDFTSVPADLNLWVPPGGQARCAAQKVVDDVGAERLSELGFRPGTSGASLNDIALSVAEKNIVATDFMSCVDMTQGVAGILMGDGRMENKPALCIAEGLASKGDLAPFVKAWAFGEAVDPMAQTGQLADDLVAYSNVCLSDTAFFFPGVNLPGDEEIQSENDANGVTTTLAQPNTTLPNLGG